MNFLVLGRTQKFQTSNMPLLPNLAKLNSKLSELQFIDKERSKSELWQTPQKSRSLKIVQLEMGRTLAQIQKNQTFEPHIFLQNLNIEPTQSVRKSRTSNFHSRFNTTLVIFLKIMRVPCKKRKLNDKEHNSLGSVS